MCCSVLMALYGLRVVVQCVYQPIGTLWEHLCRIVVPVIAEHDKSCSLQAYMRLPVSQYVLIDVSTPHYIIENSLAPWPVPCSHTVLVLCLPSQVNIHWSPGLTAFTTEPCRECSSVFLKSHVFCPYKITIPAGANGWLFNKGGRRCF